MLRKDLLLKERNVCGGNLVDWWQEDTKNKYLDKAKCIIGNSFFYSCPATSLYAVSIPMDTSLFTDQYANYTVEVDGESLHLNGINTQGENIADNGGIKNALRSVGPGNVEELSISSLEPVNIITPFTLYCM
jgi:predicted metalloendopeptidase